MNLLFSALDKGMLGVPGHPLNLEVQKRGQKEKYAIYNTIYPDSNKTRIIIHNHCLTDFNTAASKEDHVRQYS